MEDYERRLLYLEILFERINPSGLTSPSMTKRVFTFAMYEVVISIMFQTFYLIFVFGIVALAEGIF